MVIAVIDEDGCENAEVDDEDEHAERVDAAEPPEEPGPLEVMAATDEEVFRAELMNLGVFKSRILTYRYSCDNSRERGIQSCLFGGPTCRNQRASGFEQMRKTQAWKWRVKSRLGRTSSNSLFAFTSTRKADVSIHAY